MPSILYPPQGWDTNNWFKLFVVRHIAIDPTWANNENCLYKTNAPAVSTCSNFGIVAWALEIFGVESVNLFSLLADNENGKVAFLGSLWLSFTSTLSFRKYNGSWILGYSKKEWFEPVSSQCSYFIPTPYKHHKTFGFRAFWGEKKMETLVWNDGNFNFRSIFNLPVFFYPL